MLHITSLSEGLDIFKALGSDVRIEILNILLENNNMLKIDQAQFRELESFTKFGGDIDPVTARVIDKGRKNERLLIQPQYEPMAVEDEVAVIFCGTKGLLEDVPLDKVAEFQKLFLQLLHAKYQKDVLDAIAAGQLTDDITDKLTQAAREIASRYKN